MVRCVQCDAAGLRSFTSERFDRKIKMKQHKVEEEYVCMDDRPLIRDVERERVKELVESFHKKEENATPTKVDERFEIGSRVWVSHRRGELYFEAAVQNDENDLWTVVRYLDDNSRNVFLVATIFFERRVHNQHRGTTTRTTRATCKEKKTKSIRLLHLRHTHHAQRLGRFH